MQLGEAEDPLLQLSAPLPAPQLAQPLSAAPSLSNRGGS